MRRLMRRIGARSFPRRGFKPLFESNAADTGIVVGDERAILQLGAEIVGFRIGHDLAGVAHRLQVAGDEIAKPGTLRARNLNDAVRRRCKGRVCHEICDVIGGDRLQKPVDRRVVSPMVPDWAMPPRNSMNWVEWMIV